MRLALLSLPRSPVDPSRNCICRSGERWLWRSRRRPCTFARLCPVSVGTLRVKVGSVFERGSHGCNGSRATANKLLPLIRCIRVIRVSKQSELSQQWSFSMRKRHQERFTLSFPMHKTLFALLCIASSASAQNLSLKPNPTMTPRIRAALDVIKADNAWTLEQQRTICEIPAPPFKEAARGREMKRRFEALAYQNLRIDSCGNVIVERAGNGSWPTLVIAGHLDTVFPDGTNVKVKVTGTRMDGPGIGDDCRGLAVLLAVARAYAKAHVETNGTVYFVANVGDEGPGNLRGTRYLFEHQLKGKIDAFISVDAGGAVGHITDRAVGSIRYNVTFHGPGGHSYGAFGTPNPIHALGRAIAAIGDIVVPTSPKTTFNVGVIDGGTAVNSIPFSGSAQIDSRAEAPEPLDRVNAKLLDIFARARDAENARLQASDPKRS